MKQLSKKFNLFDGAVILFLGFAIGFFVLRFMTVGGDYINDQPVTMVFLEEDCPSYVVEYTQIGDNVLDATRNVQLGTVTDVQVVEATSDEGDILNVFITVSGEGTPTSNGVVVEYDRYGVGYTTTLYAGHGQYKPTLYSIDWD